MPDVLLACQLLKGRLLKAYPNTNKDAGKNALLTTYGCSSPRREPAPEVCLASAWGDSEGPHPGVVFPPLSFLSLVNSSTTRWRVAFEPPHLQQGEAVLEGHLQVLRFRKGGSLD